MGTNGYSTDEINANPKALQWIKAWMLAHLEDHRDPQTDEIDCTGLVEDWDRSCADGAVTLDSDHPAWDLAVRVVGEAA